MAKTYLDLRYKTAGTQLGWIDNETFKLLNITICEVRKFGTNGSILVSLFYLQVAKFVFSFGWLILKPKVPLEQFYKANG